MAVSLAFMVHRELTTSVPENVFRRRTVQKQLQCTVKAFSKYVQNITNDNYAAGQAGLNDLAYLVLSELGKDGLAEDFRKARDELIERGQSTPRLRERPTRAEFEARKREEEKGEEEPPPKRRPKRP